MRPIWYAVYFKEYQYSLMVKRAGSGWFMNGPINGIVLSRLSRGMLSTQSSKAGGIQ